MDFDIHADSDFYYIPTQLDEKIVEVIKSQYLDANFEESTIHFKKESTYVPEVRKSKNAWIPTDSWIAGLMSHMVNCANNSYYHFDIDKWADQIQYTVYDQEGDHYTWHQDTALSSFDSQICRKLSISLLLSDPSDYEGGELQLLYSDKRVVTLKPELGAAIIFPSSVRHRVRKVKSGRRESLVGWYGGPLWK